MTAVPEDAWRLTAFPATGLLVDVSNVTTAVVPSEPSGAGVGAVTVDCEAETVSVPNVTEAVLEITVLVVRVRRRESHRLGGRIGRREGDDAGRVRHVGGRGGRDDRVSGPERA